MATFGYTLRGNTIQYYICKGKFEKIQFSTGIKLNKASSWDANNQKIKNTKSEPLRQSNNDELDALKSYILEGIKELKKQELEITKDRIKKIGRSFEYIEASLPQVKTQLFHFNLTDHLATYIDLISSGEIQHKSGKFGIRTIKNYKTLLTRIKEFEKANSSIKPNKVDKQLYDKFLKFFRTESNVIYKDSYISRLLNGLKSFLDNYLIAVLKLNFPNYQPKQWKKLTSKTLTTYLTMKQLQIMLELDLSSYDQEYSKVRDAFVFSSLTAGFRIGDYLTLNDHNLVNHNKQLCIDYIQQKTKNRVVAPISELCESIIKRNNGFPKIKNDTSSNKLIKKICQLCEFDKMCYLEDNNGNIIEKAKQYELICNHTARRSFCTNAYKQGTDTIQIMSISGHKSAKVFLNYIKVSEEEHALRMTKTKFFKMQTIDFSPQLQVV